MVEYLSPFHMRPAPLGVSQVVQGHLRERVEAKGPGVAALAKPIKESSYELLWRGDSPGETLDLFASELARSQRELSVSGLSQVATVLSQVGEAKGPQLIKTNRDKLIDNVISSLGTLGGLHLYNFIRDRQLLTRLNFRSELAVLFSAPPFVDDPLNDEDVLNLLYRRPETPPLSDELFVRLLLLVTPLRVPGNALPKSVIKVLPPATIEAKGWTMELKWLAGQGGTVFYIQDSKGNFGVVSNGLQLQLPANQLDLGPYPAASFQKSLSGLEPLEGLRPLAPQVLQQTCRRGSTVPDFVCRTLKGSPVPAPAPPSVLLYQLWVLAREERKEVGVRVQFAPQGNWLWYVLNSLKTSRGPPTEIYLIASDGRLFKAVFTKRR